MIQILNQSKKTRPLFAMIILAMLSTYVFAQRPIVKSFKRKSAANHEILTIQGSSFGSDENSLKVLFGSTSSTPIFSSDELLEVRVPSGAIFSNLAVINTTSGQTGFSQTPFVLSFPGEHGFETTSLEGQKDFDAESGLYDLCLCDLDSDGRNDIMAPSEQSSSAALLLNTTNDAGIENISFVKNSILINARTIHVKCGDLNGDGKPDLVLTEAGDGDKIFFLQNNSSGQGDFQFTTSIVNLPGKKVKRMEIADMDLDGKPELIVTNQSGSTVTILINQSNLTNISFSNSAVVDIDIPVPLNRGFDGIAVADLNNDKLPDLVTSQFQTAISNLYIIPNESSTGEVKMGDIHTYDLSGTAVSIKVGDLDNDDKPDIAATLLLESSVAIFRNESNNESLEFAAPVLIECEERPYGLDFGDLDGDGKTDMAVASILRKSITVLNNSSTPGNFSFQKTVKPTTYINRHVAIGDLDGDGKPDITFTSIDDNSKGILASKISVFRNTRCIIPEIQPEGPHTICTGNSVELFTTPGRGLVFEWKKDGTTIAGEAEPLINIAENGSFNVTTTSTADEGCEHTSNSVTVAIETGSALSGVASVLPVDPICSGNSVALKVVDVGATSYKWKGPEGYQAEGLTADPPVSDFQSANAGRYTVDIYAGDCVAQTASIVIGILEAPAFHLNASDDIVVCESETKTLTVSPQLESFAYQWFEESMGALPGQTATSLNVTAPGTYYVTATTLPSCASGETESTNVIFADKPEAKFNAPATACISQEILFEDASTSDPNMTLFYQWEFGDDEQSMDKNPSHQYTSFSTFPVTLTVSYADGFCSDEFTQSIAIEQAPQVSITNESNQFSICEDGTLTLQVEGFDSFAWSTGETTSSIEITQPGLYTVEARTLTGCIANGSQEVTLFAEPVVTASVTPEEITEGETAQLTASGLVEYLWEPAETLTGAGTSSAIAAPVETTIYKVKGVDEHGCTGEAEVTLRVKGELATKKIVPSKFFSPGNGDNINATWLIEKILNYPYCQVTIYDDKGVTIFEAKPYLNTWDGTYHGRQLPDGVYFYFIKCDGEENSPKTGTITLLR